MKQSIYRVVYCVAIAIMTVLLMNGGRFKMTDCDICGSAFCDEIHNCGDGK